MFKILEYQYVYYTNTKKQTKKKTIYLLHKTEIFFHLWDKFRSMTFRKLRNDRLKLRKKCVSIYFHLCLAKD